MTNKPLAHMDTFASSGLQNEAPVRSGGDSFENTQTSLVIDRATPATPVYGRITARMEPHSPFSLDGANWVWYPDDDPPWDRNHPLAQGDRYFRHSFNVEEEPTDAKLVFTADNLATASVNGRVVGRSDNGFDGDPSHSWEHASVVDVTDALRAGENVLAFEVERFGYYAGLLGRLYIEVGEGEQTINTGGDWMASQDPADGWTALEFDDSDWVNVAVLGEYGMDPWGQRVALSQNPAAVRLALRNGDDVAYTDPVFAESTGVRTTGWQRVPTEFNEGTATLQTANARVTAVTLELAVRNDI